MFTGIIQHSATIQAFEKLPHGARLRLRSTDEEPYARGESVAVNGVCLTVLPEEDGSFVTDVSNETLAKTTLGRLREGSRVNLEKALRAGQALGGHYVTGHVDGIARVQSTHDDGRSWRVVFEVPEPLARYIASKG